MSIISEQSAAEFVKGSGAFMIADRRVAELYPECLSERSFIVDSGEELKSFAKVETFIKWLADNGCNRGSEIVALGGGTVGDMAGFAAAIYMRGVKFHNIPTTLLSMVDSAIGGKTAVNVGSIKNLVGAFHQPTNVIIDIAFLKSITDNDFLSGFGEIIKTAAIADQSLFNMLLNERDRVLRREIGDIITRVCNIKADTVRRDPYDNGIRVILNAGHT
ncbi:MAG: 3-dehydroquinate synthase, partial [Deferribacteraceae bacterium]|nr:3-dehydroquinate synthase [Deferribacteraceae bacterium]